MKDLLQQLFTKIVTHLRTQGKQCRGKTITSPDEPACAYRNDAGLKCAVGCLIADKYYDKALEGMIAHDDPVMDAVRQSLADEGIIIPESIGDYAKDPVNFETVATVERLLREMQRIHDHFTPSEWEMEFIAAAKRFDLSLEPADEHCPECQRSFGPHYKGECSHA